MLLSGVTRSLVVDEKELSRYFSFLIQFIKYGSFILYTVQCAQFLSRRLLALQESTGYDILQKQGQRIFGGPPPGWTGPPPGRGTEIYCYRIPRYRFQIV